MTFSFNPDDGPARIMRYVEPGTLPGKNLLCIWDQANNLLVINRELFEQLTPVQKSQTLRTQRTSITMEEFGYPSKEAA